MTVIGFWHFDAMALAELHHDIEEIHGIELQLIAQANLRLDGTEIFVRCDVSNDVDH